MIVMVVQYHTDIDSTGIVLHVLKVFRPAALDTDTLYFTNPILFLSSFLVSLLYYLTVLVTLLVLTVEIEVKKYVMAFKHYTNESYSSNIILICDIGITFHSDKLWN